MPIGRRAYWDKVARRERVRQYRASQPERSEFYKWTKFDDRVIDTGAIKFLPDDVDFSAKQLAERLPETAPDKFRRFEVVISGMRKLLPLQLHGSIYNNHRALAQEAIRMAISDLDIAMRFHAPITIGSPGIAQMYASLTENFGHPIKKPKTVIRTKTDQFGKDDIEIAQKFADTLLGQYGPMDLGLLRQYRQSDFHTVFRDFVRTTVTTCDKPFVGKTIYKVLTDEFDARLEAPRGRVSIPLRGLVTQAIRTSIVALTIAKLIAERVNRRTSLKIGAAIATTWVTESLSPLVPSTVTLAQDSLDRMVALIATPNKRSSVWK